MVILFDVQGLITADDASRRIWNFITFNLKFVII